MLKMLIAGGLLIPALALAEPVKVAKTVICDDAQKMIEYFEKEHNESPLWMGTVVKNENFMIMVNLEKQTWTALQFDLTLGMSCVIETGTGFKFKIPGKDV